MRDYIKRDILFLINNKPGLNITQLCNELPFSYVTIHNCITEFRIGGAIETKLHGTNRICNITDKGCKYLKELIRTCPDNK